MGAMTPEEEIVALRAALALEQAKVRELTATIERIATNVTEADSARARTLEEESRSRSLRRERNRRYREARKTQEDAGETSQKTPSSIPPPLKGSPPLPVPIPPSPISSPPSLFPPSSVASSRPAKKAKEAKKPADKPADPRHAPLVKELVEVIGFPFDGGKDGKNVEALLGLADQQEATRGEAAGQEVLRRARIAWGQFPDFNSARTLGDLRAHWGRFAEARGQRPLLVSQANVGGHDDSRRECDGCGADGSGAGVGNPEVWLGYECGCLRAFKAAQSDGLHFTKAQEWARKRREHETA